MRSPTPSYAIVKRAFDTVSAIALLVLTSPLALLIASAILVVDGRPILFKQVRPGRYEEAFTLFKFRTMKLSRGPDGRLLPDRERMTRLGRYLRRASLDELPQLVNVLRGDMSFVGPRPLLFEYLPCYNGREAKRHEVRPGITGLAQINGRNHLSWDDRLEMDVEYVETLSFARDARILRSTVGKVFSGDGVAVPGTVSVKLSDERRCADGHNG